MARKVKFKKKVEAKKVAKRTKKKSRRVPAAKAKAKKTPKTKAAKSKQKPEAQGDVVEINSAAYAMGYLIP
jgi:hypothetical protein